MKSKLRQWKKRCGELVNYLRNEVYDLFGSKDKDIYNYIVDDLKDKDFLYSNDYEKIHIKYIIKKIEIKEEKNMIMILI